MTDFLELAGRLTYPAPMSTDMAGLPGSSITSTQGTASATAPVEGPLRYFASDNYAPCHPEILEAMVQVNSGSAASYGADQTSLAAQDLIREILQAPQAAVSFVSTGTAANVLGMASILRPWQSILCASTAHITNDECGAPERFLGSKIVSLPHVDGKLDPDTVRQAVVRVGDEHATQATVLSLSQSTETGTVYSLSELHALAETAHELGLKVHLDGARLSNAAVSLGCSLAELTTGVGIDLLSLGATKNGALGAEAIVVFDPTLEDDLRFIRKQAMQLSSKQRFIAAQFLAMFGTDLWQRNARHANAMAARLAQGAAERGVQITNQVQANAIFAILPEQSIPALQARNHFYMWDEHRHEVRWMCGWDTTETDVDAFLTDIEDLVRG